MNQVFSARPVTPSRGSRSAHVGLIAPRYVRGAVLVAAVLHASAAPAAAQDPLSCPDGRIIDIVVENQSVFDLTDPSRSGRYAWAYRVANSLHVRTRVEVIQREILFEVGDCYDVEVLRDSERLLRSFPFIANADIYGIRQADEGVQVVVDTQDEWSTRIKPGVSSREGIALNGIALVEDNLLGTGRHVSLFYDNEQDERLYGAAYSTPQLFRSRWNMGLQLERTEVGHSYHESVIYPFVGEAGRLAFRQTISRDDRYFEILMPDAGEDLLRILVPVRREQFEVGAATRSVGARYRHTLLGVGLAGERIGYPEPPTFEDPTGRTIAAVTTVGTEWSPVSSVRLMLLMGQQNVWFVRRRAIDTVNGVEDLQLGVEAEASLGPSLPVFSDEHDISVGVGLYAAGELTPAKVVGGHFAIEARRSYETLANLPEWNDVLAEFDLWTYLRSQPESRHTFVASFSGVGGWHGRTPFQLTLGGDSGLRGYPNHVDPGGRRLAASLEHRAYLGGPLRDLFDAGTVAFLDVGKIWPGHVAFGTESPVRASVGVGLRAAFPPGSRQTFRIDVGFPVERSAGFGSIAISLGVGQAIGRQGGRRDPQLRRSARYGLATSDFVFP